MAWAVRGAGRYYTRSGKAHGRVTRVYIGLQPEMMKSMFMREV